MLDSRIRAMDNVADSRLIESFVTFIPFQGFEVRTDRAVTLEFLGLIGLKPSHLDMFL